MNMMINVIAIFFILFKIRERQNYFVIKLGCNPDGILRVKQLLADENGTN